MTDALARWWTELGHRVVVLAKGKSVELGVPYSVQWFRRPKTLRARPAAMASAIGELDKRERFDVWCVNYGYPTGYGAIQAKKRDGGPPIVLVSHGGDLYRSTKNRRIRSIWNATTHAYQHADGLIAISPYVEQLIEEVKSQQTPLELIPNGIDLRPFETPARRPEDLRIDSPFCLALGNFGPMKGFADAIAGYAKARHALDDLALVLVGDGRQAEELRRLAERLGVAQHVYFVGRRFGEEKRWFLQNARFGLIPSLEEGHPVVGLEFLAAGKPVICTNIGAFDGMFVDGKNAIRLPPGDPEVLADGLIRWQRADLSDMIAVSRSVARRYDGLTLASKYLRFFDRLMPAE